MSTHIPAGDNAITKAIRKQVDARVSLIKGEGYCYFCFEDEVTKYYETESVYVPRISDCTRAWWISRARTFAKEQAEKSITYAQPREPICMK